MSRSADPVHGTATTDPKARTSPPGAAGNGAPGLDPRSVLAVLGGVAVVALVVAVIAAYLSGAANAPVAGITDPGPAVRWGLIISRVIHDLAAAITIGVLLLSATIIPDPNPKDPTFHTGPRRTAAHILAAGAAFVWALAGFVQVLLGFSDISLLPMSSPRFGSAFMATVMQLEPLRNEIFVAVIALVVSSFAAIARSRPWTVGLAFLSLFALVPLAFSGHSSSNVDHETAVNMLGVHLVSVTIWVGGLIGIIALRDVIGNALTIVLERFSYVAAWCFAGVAISGIILAVAQVQSFSDVVKPYGMLVIAKIVVLVFLGAVAVVQRRKSLAELRRIGASSTLFIRATAVEVALMAAAVGLATSLSRTAPPVEGVLPDTSAIWNLTGFPDPGKPDSMTWITAWRIDWFWAGITVVAIGLYLAGVIRLHRRGDHWPIGRAINWTIGWLVFGWATNSAPMIYGRLSFSWHMAFHMLLVMLIPVFLALGAPVTLTARALKHRRDGTMGPRELLLGYVHSRWAAFFGNPVVASINFFGSMIVFYYSPLFELALRSHGGHIAMIVHFMMAGYVFAWMLMGVDPGPKRWAAPLRVVVLFAAISFHAFFGVSIASGSTLLAPDFFKALHVPWIPDLLADQQAGGNITWAIGEVPTLALALLVTLAWSREDKHESMRLDRQADRDGDAELTAYNARLAAIAKHDKETQD